MPRDVDAIALGSNPGEGGLHPRRELGRLGEGQPEFLQLRFDAHLCHLLIAFPPISTMPSPQARRICSESLFAAVRGRRVLGTSRGAAPIGPGGPKTATPYHRPLTVSGAQPPRPEKTAPVIRRGGGHSGGARSARADPEQRRGRGLRASGWDTANGRDPVAIRKAPRPLERAGGDEQAGTWYGSPRAARPTGGAHGRTAQGPLQRTSG